MMKTFIVLLSFILSFSMSLSVFSQQNYSIDEQEQSQISDAELAQILAPIALYPDSLLTHILISSTYPIEVIKAHRWLKNNTELNTDQIAQAIEGFDWDPSVKALVPFEPILSHLSEDLTWMQSLGEAFLEDETRVLEGIQTLREKAKLAGNLSQMNNMEISYEDNNIIIEPIKKEVVYVPYYDTRMVYGVWHWSSYPPVYWRPSFQVSLSNHNPFYWHSSVHISFNYFFSAFQWKKRHVIVVNPYNSRHYRKPSVISKAGYAKRWVHQPIHRKGVTYRSKVTAKKYHGKKAKVHNKIKSSQHIESKIKQKKVVNSKVNASSKKTQKMNVKQHQTKNYKAPNTKKTVKKYNHSGKSRQQHSTPSKAYRSRDSKANN